ncbi:LysR family transcriptional regulator [Nocardia sp. NBC_00511]|uniref:LysR family transcriptional regulator n=1 Tax=Nocardia sp. NBC_00511 TaxID=2903591 RepID=UPI0030E516BE
MLGADLEWFTTLAETENVSAAADRLHLAQPTLSRMLARLERRLGTPLFDRHGKRITLNDNGRLYYEHARRARAELQAAEQAVADRLNPAKGLIRLSFLHSFGSSLAPQLIAEFRRTAGKVDFTLFQGAAEVITRQVLDGEADLALVSPRPSLPGIGWRKLLSQPLVLAVPQDHRLATHRHLRLADLSDAEFITMHQGFGMRRLFDDLCAAADLRPRIAFESSDLMTVSGLIAAGLGIGLIPLESPTPPGITTIPLTDPGATRDVGLIWSPTATPTTPVHLFRTFTTTWSTRHQP